MLFRSLQPAPLPAAPAAAAAPSPVVKLGGALDFGLNAPLASSTWVNDWVAGSRQTAPNDWKVTL